MNFLKPTLIIYIVMFSAMYLSVIGYPMTNTLENLLNKDEKRYPNGTVIGQYTYGDNEGNPIHVKYYADGSSYGVELKRVKIVSPDFTSMEITERPFDSTLDSLNSFKDLIAFHKKITHDPLHIFKDKGKSGPKNSGEFEILLENELKAPEKCGKEKVKVYFDKDKRKTRNALDNYDSMNYCNRI